MRKKDYVSSEFSEFWMSVNRICILNINWIMKKKKTKCVMEISESERKNYEMLAQYYK